MYSIPSIISTVVHMYFQIMGSIALAMAIICRHSIKSTVLSIFLQMHEYIYASTVCNGSHKSSVKFLQKPLNVILFGIRPLYAKRNEEKKVCTSIRRESQQHHRASIVITANKTSILWARNHLVGICPNASLVLFPFIIHP